MRPLAVHHVSINVDDIAAAIAFYCDTLRLEQRTDRPDFGFGGAWLDAGGQQVHLIDGTTRPATVNISPCWSTETRCPARQIDPVGACGPVPYEALAF